MANWVTFYWSMMGGIEDVVEHRNKENAKEYFQKHCLDYFQKPPGFNKKQISLPYSFGFPHRKFYGMTKYKFQKLFEKDGEQK